MPNLADCDHRLRLHRRLFALTTFMGYHAFVVDGLVGGSNPRMVGGGFRWAGMNYPLIMTLLGLLIWASSWLVEKSNRWFRSSAPPILLDWFCFFLRLGCFPSSAITTIWGAGQPSNRAHFGTGRRDLRLFWPRLRHTHLEAKTIPFGIFVWCSFWPIFTRGTLNIFGTAPTKVSFLPFWHSLSGGWGAKPSNGAIKRKRPKTRKGASWEFDLLPMRLSI